MAIGSIVITENPVTLWESFEDTLPRARLINPQTVHRDIGGFWSASFSIDTTRNRAVEYLNNGVGRSVQIYNDDGRLDWEGFIDSVEIDTGSAKVRNTLENMGNKVWCRYQPVGGGAATTSAIYEHAASQERFGVKHWILAAGEVSAAVAGQLAFAYLNLNYWPQPSLDDINLAGQVGTPRVKFKCLGWWHTLKWCAYNRAGAAVVSASLVVGDICADPDCGQFIAGTNISTNVTQITREYDSDRRAASILEGISALGDVSFNKWVIGMGAGRVLYYRQGARSY